MNGNLYMDVGEVRNKVYYYYVHLYSNEGEKIHFLQCLRIREWYHKSLDSIPRMIPVEDASNLHANVYINLRIVDWQQ